MSPVAYRLVRRAPSVADARPDDGQARVVGHGSGPLLVLGGPGSGKTWALVEAVAARLGRDDGHVVVLTHDAGSAARLRDRLAQRAPGAGRARVTTWAGLSLALVDRAEPRPRLIGAVEQDVTLRELIAGLPADVWPAAWADARLTKGFARQAGEALALLRREGVGPGRLAAAGRDQGKPEWVGLARLAREYFAGLALAGAVDFPGLLERAIELAGEDQDAARWGDLVGAFYIDHYEEVEPGHLRLLSRLAGPGATVVAFGDPRQSVGSFRGAAARSILDFPDLFPGAEVVELGGNHRAGGALRQAVDKVAAGIALPRLWPPATRPPGLEPGAAAPEPDPRGPEVLDRAGGRVEVPDGVRAGGGGGPIAEGGVGVPDRVWDAAGGGPITEGGVVASDRVPAGGGDGPRAEGRVEVRVLDTATAEADWIAARLRAERLAGRAWEAMAVVVRSIGLVGPLAAALAAAGVPVAVGWSDIPLADEPVAAALLDGLLARGAGVAEDRVVDLLWAVWTDSGWPERITAGLAGDAAERLAAGRDLDAATALIDLAHARADWRGEAGVALFAEEVAEQAIPVGRARSPEGNRPGVAVLTAHRAKGREWPVVVVAGVQEGLWPNLGRRRGLIRLDHLTDDGRFDEPVFGERLLAERRLFLSAVGRAGESLVVTAVDDGGLGDLAPSRFLATLGVSARLGGEEPGEPVTLTGLVGRLRQAAADPRAHPALRAAAEARLADLADATGADGRALAPAADPARWWGVETGWFSNEDQVVASVLTGVDQWGVAADGVPRISGSQLQALLACPRRWFLDHRARADQGGTPQRRFGSLLHSLAQRLAAGDLDREAASLELDRAWDSVGFTAPWQALAQRGQAEAALDRHTAWEAAQRGHAVVGLEAPFDTEVRVAGRAVRLVGRIDRIDRERDGRCRIVDFKTGRQAPSGPEVASHLQLGLYQLAVQSGGLVGLVGRDPVLAGAELVFLRLAAGRGSRQPKALRQAGLSAVPQLDPPAQYAALRRGGRDLGLDACGPFPTWVHRALAAAVLLLDEGRFPAVGGPDCVRCAFRGGCPAAAVDEEEAPQ